MAEDHIKDFAKIVDRIYESLEEAKDLSCIWVVCQSELMSGYLKLARPEKVQKIHADYQSQITSKGLENTTAHITLEMMLVQSFQDPMAAEEHLAKVIRMNEIYDKNTQKKSLIGIYLRQHQIGQIF